MAVVFQVLNLMKLLNLNNKYLEKELKIKEMGVDILKTILPY